MLIPSANSHLLNGAFFASSMLLINLVAFLSPNFLGFDDLPLANFAGASSMLPKASSSNSNISNGWLISLFCTRACARLEPSPSKLSIFRPAKCFRDVIN